LAPGEAVEVLHERVDDLDDIILVGMRDRTGKASTSSINRTAGALARAPPRSRAASRAADDRDGPRRGAKSSHAMRGRHILIAVARYLAAHSPTERAALQTADIARRLMRGGELHQDVIGS